jgi:anti-anti-sigma factor
MMADYLQVQAERRNGLCVLRVTGELDTMMAGLFAERAEAAVQAIPRPVLIDLSGLTFIDAGGARALATAIGTFSAAVRSCPPHVRQTLDLLGLPPWYLTAGNTAVPRSGTSDLVDLVRRARSDASEAKQGASLLLDRLTGTCTRLAVTRERSDLVREQGRRTVASSRAAREHAMRSRQAAPV